MFRLPNLRCHRVGKYGRINHRSARFSTASELNPPPKPSDVELYSQYLASIREAQAKKPKLLQAYAWSDKYNPTGWWMSEKLDGVRALWDGSYVSDYLIDSANTFMLYAPDWFKKGLITTETLDGELFGGRQKFQQTVGIVKSMDGDWSPIKFYVFDIPSKGSLPFEERMSLLEKLLKDAPAHVQLVQQELCKGYDHLKQKLAEIEANGGEGLMLRMAKSPYIGQRSHTLLKVKSFCDAEAKVLSVIEGTGKYKGMMGALQVQLLPAGATFCIGTGFTDKDRADPPKVGDIITFRYSQLTDSGIPRFPRYVGKRIDYDPETATPPASAPPIPPNELSDVTTKSA